MAAMIQGMNSTEHIYKICSFLILSTKYAAGMLTEAPENLQTKEQWMKSGKASYFQKKNRKNMWRFFSRQRNSRTQPDTVEDKTVTETNENTESEVSTAPAYYKFLKHVIDSTIKWIRGCWFPCYYNPLATLWLNRVEPFIQGHPIPSIDIAQHCMQQASKASKVVER